MTNEEAIKALKTVYNMYDITYGDWSFCTLSVEALEKQIPKKPEKDGHMNLCPFCGSQEIEVELYDGGEETRFEFCPHCGQKLDWSEK